MQPPNIFALPLVLGMFCSLTAVAGQVWLTKTPNSNPLPGTEAEPHYISDANEYTSIITTPPYNANTEFHYAPGIYETTGWYWNQRRTANPGCKHYGSLDGETILRLVGAQERDNDGVMFGLDMEKQIADGFELHDMILDCNAANNPNFINDTGACIAVCMSGSDVLLTNLTVIGFGTRAVGKECFPVILGPMDLTASQFPAKASFDNVVVTGCVFRDPAENNLDGLSCCSILGNAKFALRNNVITNCSVLNVAEHGFSYTHAFSAPLIENCTVDGCMAAVYFEPPFGDDHVRDYVVRNNLFSNIRFGVFINFQPDTRIKSLTITGNVFSMNCVADAAAFADWGGATGGSEGFDRLSLRANEVTYPQNCDIGTGFCIYHASNSQVEDNQITLGNGNELMFNRSTLFHSMAVWNNRNESGELVLVKDPQSNTSVSQLEASLGVNPQPFDLNLSTIAGLGKASGNIMVANGSSWESRHVRGDAVLSMAGDLTAKLEVMKLTPSASPIQGYVKESLMVDKTILASGERVQHLIASGSDRSVFLPAASSGREFIIHNVGGQYDGALIIKNDSGIELIRLRNCSHAVLVGSTSSWVVQSTGREQNSTLVMSVPGWYRILTGSQISCHVEIKGPNIPQPENTRTDLQFNCYVQPFSSSVGDINLLHCENYNYGSINEIRIGTDGAGTGYVDVHATSSSGMYLLLRITGDGDAMPNPPVYLGEPGSLPLYSKSLVPGAGIRTTGSMVANELIARRLRINSTSSATLTNILYTKATLNFPLISGSGYADLQVAMSGARDGDLVSIGMPVNLVSGLSWGQSFMAWATSDAVVIRFTNIDPIRSPDLSNGTFTVKVEKYQ